MRAAAAAQEAASTFKQPNREKQSTVADQQLANPVITRKENKSYRMSDIQNLKTFGKSSEGARTASAGGEGPLLAGLRTYFDVSAAKLPF